MKIRHGFVSNSSSSSFIIHNYLKFDEIPIHDKDLQQLMFGDSVPTFKKDIFLNYQGVEIDNIIELPLDMPTVLKEIRRLLSLAVRPKENYDINILKYLKKKIQYDTGRVNAFKGYIKDAKIWIKKDSKSDEDIKEIREWIEEHETNLKNAPTNYPYNRLTLKDAYELFISKTDVSSLYLIPTRNGYTEGMGGDREHRFVRVIEKDGELYVDGSNLYIDEIIESASKFGASWCIFDDNAMPDEIYLMSDKKILAEVEQKSYEDNWELLNDEIYGEHLIRDNYIEETEAELLEKLKLQYKARIEHIKDIFTNKRYIDEVNKRFDHESEYIRPSEDSVISYFKRHNIPFLREDEEKETNE